MKLNLVPTDEGIVMSVKAKPNSRSDAIVGFHNGMLKVSVTDSPEKGKANQAIIKLLAKRLSLPKSNIELISGESSSTKKVLFRNMNEDRIMAILLTEVRSKRESKS